MSTKKTGVTRTYELNADMVSAMKKAASEHIRAWWEATATDDEKAQAIARGATAKGAYEFVEKVVKKHKGKTSCVCLPDQLVYDLAGIFLRNGADGDEFLTTEEIAEREKNEAERKRKAEEAEAKRKESLTPEKLAEEKRIEDERKAKAEADAKAKAEEEAAKLAKLKERERQKAIAEEMKARQLTFDF